LCIEIIEKILNLVFYSDTLPNAFIAYYTKTRLIGCWRKGQGFNKTKKELPDYF